MFNKIQEFRRAFGFPVPDEATPLEITEKQYQCRMITDEVVELSEATNLIDQLGEALDIVWLAKSAIAGIGFSEHQYKMAMEILAQANMAKIWPDGKAHFSESGKILKPDGWQKPDYSPCFFLEKDCPEYYQIGGPITPTELDLPFTEKDPMPEGKEGDVLIVLKVYDMPELYYFDPEEKLFTNSGMCLKGFGEAGYKFSRFDRLRYGIFNITT